MDIAKLVSKMSKYRSNPNGACIVNSNYQIYGYGYTTVPLTTGDFEHEVNDLNRVHAIAHAISNSSFKIFKDLSPSSPARPTRIRL